MSTSKSPSTRRILREASELASNPSPDFTAHPLESDLFEWHFTMRGPPAPSPFAGGLYHGRIVLPPAYPLKPPSFRFLTPTGRFETNREICLSISGHHEESWQPAWGIRTALVAIRSFMDTDAKGQVGGMEGSEMLRRRFADGSGEWKCRGCGRSNREIMEEHEGFVAEVGQEGKEGGEVVPEGLRLGYREDLGKVREGAGTAPSEEGMVAAKASVGTEEQSNVPVSAPAQRVAQTTAEADPQPAAQPAAAQVQVVRLAPARNEAIPAWIDKAIFAVLAALVAIVWMRYIA